MIKKQNKTKQKNMPKTNNKGKKTVLQRVKPIPYACLVCSQTTLPCRPSFIKGTKLLYLTHCPRRLGPPMLRHRQRKKKSQKIALLPIASKFGPQEVDSFSQLCAQFQPPVSFELDATIFQKCRKMAVRSEKYLGYFCIE